VIFAEKPVAALSYGTAIENIFLILFQLISTPVRHHTSVKRCQLWRISIFYIVPSLYNRKLKKLAKKLKKMKAESSELIPGKLIENLEHINVILICFWLERRFVILLVVTYACLDATYWVCLHSGEAAYNCRATVECYLYGSGYRYACGSWNLKT